MPQSFSEVPEPDRVEQSQDLEVVDEFDGEDVPPTGSTAAVREADPGDISEQSFEVRLDDDDHRE